MCSFRRKIIATCLPSYKLQSQQGGSLEAIFTRMILAGGKTRPLLIRYFQFFYGIWEGPTSSLVSEPSILWPDISWGLIPSRCEHAIELPQRLFSPGEHTGIVLLHNFSVPDKPMMGYWFLDCGEFSFPLDFDVHWFIACSLEIENGLNK